MSESAVDQLADNGQDADDAVANEVGASNQPTDGDVAVTGSNFSQRLRPDGTIVPRNALIFPVQNRTDLRVQQRIPLPGRISIDGIAEVFNVFNRTNYTLDTQEVNRATTYLQPTAGQNRTAQIGFRVTF